MSNIEIREVKTKKDFKDFIKVQWIIYKGDKYWVPPLIMDMNTKFNPKKNPLFEHADIISYIALKDGKLAGRITGIIHHIHNDFHKEKTGFFGFFETIDDYEVASKLFDTVKTWIKQKGMNTMRGPANFSSNDELGMLVEGFDASPMIMMTYNPKYYLDIMDRYGFKKAKDVFAFKIDLTADFSDRVKRVADAIKAKSNITIRKINIKDFDNEMKTVKEIYNKAWQYNWGAIPMTDKEFEHLAVDLKAGLVPDLILVAEVDGKPAGFCLSLPDYNEIMKKLNGRLFPFGIITLLLNKSKVKTVRMLTLGVIREYQKRGIESVFYSESFKTAQKMGMKWGEVSWVLEDNVLMIRGIELMGGQIYKKYRVYDYKL